MDLRAQLRKLHSAEAAFVMAGLFFIGVAFAFDVSRHWALVSAEPGHDHGGGDLFLRVNIPVMAIAFVAFGLGMYVAEHRRDRVHLTALAAGLLILADGVVHLFAVSDHLDEPLHAGAFAVLAPLQVAAGVLFPFLPRKLDKGWLALTIVLIVVYVVSRRVALPPLWDLEEVETLGVFSKMLELFALVPLWSLAMKRRDASAATATPRPTEP